MVLPRKQHPLIADFNNMEAQYIAKAQAKWTADWHSVDEDPENLKGIWIFIHANHRQNFNLWHEEDKARRDDKGFEYIANAKRAIDSYNQKRNDFIERIDEFLFEELKPATKETPLNSETPGMIIDRLSIMALKHFHMLEQTERDDVSEEHIESCRKNASVLETQRSDLTRMLAEFMEEIKSGKRTYKVYFQFKMYNDPNLNPALYSADKA